jgi:hypothetical protein
MPNEILSALPFGRSPGIAPPATFCSSASFPRISVPKMRAKSSKREKRIRLFGNIAKSDVRAVAIECRRKISWQYEGKQSNCYSTRALVLVLRRARFRGV